MPAIQNVERRGAVYYWRRTIRFQDGKPLTIRLSLRTTDQSVARRMASAMTTKSETLRMNLGYAGSTATLTTGQKADIFRKAMEDMRDVLDRNHVEFQREEPDQAAYLIEGLIEIYEAMLRDFVLQGIPSDVGSREHVETRMANLSEEQRETMIDFFASRPTYREDTIATAERELERVAAPKCEDTAALGLLFRLGGEQRRATVGIGRFFLFGAMPWPF